MLVEYSCEGLERLYTEEPSSLVFLSIRLRNSRDINMSTSPQGVTGDKRCYLLVREREVAGGPPPRIGDST